MRRRGYEFYLRVYTGVYIIKINVFRLTYVKLRIGRVILIIMVSTKIIR